MMLSVYVFYTSDVNPLVSSFPVCEYLNGMCLHMDTVHGFGFWPFLITKHAPLAILVVFTQHSLAD